MFSECVLGKMFNQCRRSVKDLLALERALSFIMCSIQISTLPSTTFFVFLFLPQLFKL